MYLVFPLTVEILVSWYLISHTLGKGCMTIIFFLAFVISLGVTSKADLVLMYSSSLLNRSFCTLVMYKTSVSGNALSKLVYSSYTTQGNRLNLKLT